MWRNTLPFIYVDIKFFSLVLSLNVFFFCCYCCCWNCVGFIVQCWRRCARARREPWMKWCVTRTHVIYLYTHTQGVMMNVPKKENVKIDAFKEAVSFLNVNWEYWVISGWVTSWNLCRMWSAWGKRKVTHIVAFLVWNSHNFVCCDFLTLHYFWLLLLTVKSPEKAGMLFLHCWGEQYFQKLRLEEPPTCF